MSSRLSDVVLDTRDAWALADWWASVLEVDVGEKDQGEGMRWANLVPHDSVRRMLFLDVPDGKVIKNRLHIDLSPHGCDQRTELARLKSLGAKEVDIGQAEQSWVVLADPEGNEFCLLHTRVDDTDAS